MNTLTYLNAFTRAAGNRDTIESAARDFGDRGNRGASGIAVNTDPLALKWQKFDRQAKKFERMTRLLLGDTEHWLTKLTNDQIEHLDDKHKQAARERELAETLARIARINAIVTVLRDATEVTE